MELIYYDQTECWTSRLPRPLFRYVHQGQPVMVHKKPHYFRSRAVCLVQVW